MQIISQVVAAAAQVRQELQPPQTQPEVLAAQGRLLRLQDRQ
jgi:hypothetical protein